MSPERKYPPFETVERIKKWCDRQERAHQDVIQKLYSWGVGRDEGENIVADLISENYLNEERFARDFARGKFKIKKWGWKKIEQELKQKGVSKYSIKLAKEEIDPGDYRNTLITLIEKKIPLIKGSTDWEKKQKLLKFCVNKGYKYDDVNLILNREFPDFGQE